MHKISLLNRVIFLLTGLLAGYKVVAGMDPYSDLTTFYYTLAFGMLVLASLLLMLLGFEILKNDGVLILAALIPVGLSLGLVNEFLPDYHSVYAGYSLISMFVFIGSRYKVSKKAAVVILALVHGVAGTIVVLLPVVLIVGDHGSVNLVLVSIGGIIIGLQGLLLAFFKTGKLPIAEEKIYNYFPKVLLVTSAAFVAGLYV